MPTPARHPARHIAVITSPVPGHLNPLQALGAELAGMGHQVTVVHVAGAARFVDQAGIGFAPLPDRAGASEPFGAYLTKLARPGGPLGLMRMINATAALSDALLEGAPEVFERIGIDAVIADAVEPAGPLIAQRMGVPYVVSVTGLPLVREDDVPPPFLGWRYRPDAIGRMNNRGGYAVSDLLMRPVTRVLEARRKAWRLDERGYEPRLHVAQCPAGLDYPRKRLPPRFQYGSPWRRAPVGDEPVLPDDGRPLVFCSLGTLQGSRRALLATMAEACAAVGARAVIGHGGGLSLAEEASLPGDPLVRALWPQEAVLRRCAATILHAGFNSVLDALAAGVPIVALPIAFEQPATAARLAWLGAGRVLSPRGLSVDTLARALDEVMTQPSYRAAARRIAAEIALAGGVAHAATAISEALAAPS